ELIQEIGPHAIITTNYDQLLEFAFPEYEIIIGEEIYNVNYATMGEIFKIHGCVTDPASVIITEEDVINFNKKRKYLTAKLLTYFAEHPVITLGHSAEDPDLKELLSDIDQVLAGEDDDLIDHVEFTPGIQDGDDVSKYKPIPTEDGRIRVLSISAEEYDWIYDAAGYDSEMSGVKVKYLRKLLSNTYEIVSEDAPRKEVQVEVLKNTSDEEELPKLFGVAPMDEASETVDVMRRFLFSDEDDVSSPEDEISFATFNYETNDDIISSKERILYFRKHKQEFELTDKRQECLFKSSLHNNLFGAEWLIGYEDDVFELFQETLNETDSVSAIGNLEYILLMFKEETLLKQIRDEYAADYTSIDAADLLGKVDAPLSTRVSEYYSNDRLQFLDEDITVQKLFGDEERVDELLNKVTDLLLSDPPEEKRGTSAVDLRKLELVKLGNSMRGEGLLRWMEADEPEKNTQSEQTEEAAD
ncbi:MAG: SIR2 family protein, partial [Candidatus Paceibacteria bacterium]